MLLHYLERLKIQIFCRYSADTEENANKLHFECTDFNFIKALCLVQRKSGERPSFDTANETISDLLNNIGRQRSKRSAAMLPFLVSQGV